MHRNRGKAERLQFLTRMDPLVKAAVTSNLKGGLSVRREAWGRHLKELVRFVVATGRLPQAREKGRPMHGWLYQQRASFLALPMDLQAELLHSHPLVASYVTQA